MPLMFNVMPNVIKYEFKTSPRNVLSITNPSNGNQFYHFSFIKLVALKIRIH